MDIKTIKNIEVILEFLTHSVSFENLPIADAIFVFGCRDFRVAQNAALLHSNGKANRIILTGKGNARLLPHGFKTEAEFFNEVLAESGVATNSIILEDQATNTLENVLLGMGACFKNHFYPRSLILCAKPPLLKRSQATFLKHFSYVATYCSAYEIPKEEWINDIGKIKRILGEIDRLIQYARVGDISKVDIPVRVMRAYRESGAAFML